MLSQGLSVSPRWISFVHVESVGGFDERIPLHPEIPRNFGQDGCGLDGTNSAVSTYHRSSGVGQTWGKATVDKDDRRGPCESKDGSFHCQQSGVVDVESVDLARPHPGYSVVDGLASYDGGGACSLSR